MKKIKVIIAVALAMFVWSGTSFYGGLAGWWLTPLAKQDEVEPFFDSILGVIAKDSKEDVAFIMIEEGKVVRQHFAGVENEINGDTLFATASLSKWITAYSVMTFVESGALNLDAPISSYLTRWSLPESDFDNDAVTVRHLLSHTSGLGDGLGFGDFQSNEPLPNLVESLNAPRTSNGEIAQIKLTDIPGASWNYSGGGYLVLQLIIEELSGMSYTDYVGKTVLTPLAMSRSSFDFIGDQNNIAKFYDNQAAQTPMYKYEASAATGFLSSANDLTNFVLAHTSENQAETPLSTATIKSMQQPTGRELGADIWGLGVMLYAPTSSKMNYVYGHDGSNDPALNSSVRINPDNGDAMIVLVSGNSSLASTIGYHWVLWQTGQPDFLSFEHAINSAFKPIVIGSGIIIIIVISFLFFRRRV